MNGACLSESRRGLHAKRRRSAGLGVLKPALFWALFWVGSGCERPSSSTSPAPEAPEALRMTHLTIERFERDRLRSRVFMNEVVRTSSVGAFEARAVRIEVRSQQDPHIWRIRAPRGRRSASGSAIELFGGVVVTDGVRTVKTASVVYSVEAQTLEASGAVELEAEAFRGEGTGLMGAFQTGELRILGPVRVQSRLEK